MRPALGAALALLVAVPVAFTVGFLFSPDPTGLVPVALALVLTVVFGTAIYRVVPTTSESTAD